MAGISARTSAIRFRLFGIASKARWDLLRADLYNSDYLVGYRDENWHEQMGKLSAGEGMRYAYDPISESNTVHRKSSTLALNDCMTTVTSPAGGALASDGMSIEQI
ncbi:uncharacterized protein M421DRAFT_94279 [Didymella exigua CBS 183.55]|uniref:Uncharacterized protein n=1 Tax=Didymella exigua CBS 183.55 TaxID=1150837 RepID=A0A6A5RCA7_9PLEO|nr:uncharacterized protein M421DRAFT_94279 [Didymella exigua CBS 183.55]KAF1925885.1 hypothetical protein M421DRAFT_94279 [Didymella exigua CBS 183.55]